MFGYIYVYVKQVSKVPAPKPLSDIDDNQSPRSS